MHELPATFMSTAAGSFSMQCNRIVRVSQLRIPGILVLVRGLMLHISWGVGLWATRTEEELQK